MEEASCEKLLVKGLTSIRDNLKRASVVFPPRVITNRAELQPQNANRIARLHLCIGACVATLSRQRYCALHAHLRMLCQKLPHSTLRAEGQSHSNIKHSNFTHSINDEGKKKVKTRISMGLRDSN